MAIVRVFVAAIMLLGAALAAPAARAQDAAAIEAHLSELFAGGTIRKWPGPVRFRVLGDITDPELAELRRIMATAKAATGLDIAEDTTPENAATNAPFVFTREIEPLLDDPAVAQLFRRAGEDDGAFVRRMRADFRQGSLRGTGSSPAGIVVSLQIVNTERYGPTLTSRQLLRLAFETLTETLSSNRVRPSVSNSGEAGPLADFTPFDRAVLAALYDPRIPHGARFAEVRPLLVELVRQRLAAR